METVKSGQGASGPQPQPEESMVYSREEYAKKEFWNDRFKETKGFFDWYANWKEIKPAFDEMVGDVLGYSEDMTPEDKQCINQQQ